MANGIDWSKLYAQPTPTQGVPSGGIFEGQGSPQPYSNMTYNMAGRNIVNEYDTQQEQRTEDANMFWQTVGTGSDWYNFQKPKHDAEYFRKLWKSTAGDEPGLITDQRQKLIDKFNLQPGGKDILDAEGNVIGKTEASQTWKDSKHYLEGKGVDPNRAFTQKRLEKAIPGQDAIPEQVITPATDPTYFTPESARAEINELFKEHGDWDTASEFLKSSDAGYSMGDLEGIRDYKPEISETVGAEYWDKPGAEQHLESIRTGGVDIEGFTEFGDLETNKAAIDQYLNTMGGGNFTGQEFVDFAQGGIMPEQGLLKNPAYERMVANPEAMAQVVQTPGTEAIMSEAVGAVDPVAAVYSGQTPGLLKSAVSPEVAQLGADALASEEIAAMGVEAGVEGSSMMSTMGPWAIAAMAALALGHGASRENTTIGKAFKNWGK